MGLRSKSGLCVDVKLAFQRVRIVVTVQASTRVKLATSVLSASHLCAT